MASERSLARSLAIGLSFLDGFYDFPPGREHPVDAESKVASWSTGDVAPDDTSVSATCVWQPTNPPKATVELRGHVHRTRRGRDEFLGQLHL